MVGERIFLRGEGKCLKVSSFYRNGIDLRYRKVWIFFEKKSILLLGIQTEQWLQLC